jgi:hypothetical protein
MPTPVSLARNNHNRIALPQQLRTGQGGASGHPERPADLPLNPSVPGVRERRPLGSHPLHVGRTSALTAHFWNLLLFVRDACN